MFLFGKKKTATAEEMFEAARRIEDSARDLMKTACVEGELIDILLCKDKVNKVYEIAFLGNLTKTQFELLKKAEPNFNFTTGFMTLYIDKILKPIVLFRINDEPKLSFACLLRYYIVGKYSNPALESLDYFEIFKNQEKFKLYLYPPEKGRFNPEIKNRLGYGPHLIQVREEARKAIETAGKNSTVFTESDFTFSTMMQGEIMETDKMYGELLWKKYNNDF